MAIKRAVDFDAGKHARKALEMRAVCREAMRLVAGDTPTRHTDSDHPSLALFTRA